MTRLICFVYHLYFQAVIEDLDPCTNTTSSDCCLCSQTSCDTDCPPSLFGLVANSNTYHCNLSDTEMEVTTVPETTTTTTATTTTTLLSFTKRNTTSDLNATEDLKITTESDSRQTTDSTHKSTPIIVCVTSCPTGYFHDNGRNCTKCDIACKECNSSGSDGCLECKLTYNNTCYAVCPINTVQKNLTCVDKDSTDIGDDSDKKILPIIIGASVGGAAVVVLVVVIVVCCRRRRRQGSGTPGTNKSRLSGILEVNTVIFRASSKGLRALVRVFGLP